MQENAHGGSDAVQDGQPTGDLDSTQGQPTDEGQVAQGAEPTGVEGASEVSTPESLNYESMYKELQTEFGTRNEELKGFKDSAETMDAFGGSEQLVQWATYLQNNPRFAEFIQAEQARESDEQMGYSDDMDDDTRQAMDLVRKEAKRIADIQIQEALKDRVDPIANRYKEQQLDSNLNQMDEKFGDSWRDVQDEMAVLAEKLPLEVQDAPNFDVLEDLYWKALRTTGKMDGVMASMYEKKLNIKKAHSTERPASNAGPGQAKKAMTMQEAFAQAQLNTN